MSFKEKTATGFLWTMVDTLFNYAGMFIISIVLARLLSPLEFGVIGVLAIFITIFDSLIDGGFTNALIREERVDDHDYNTVFLFNLLLSILLYTLFFFCAPVISIFFKDESLIIYARVMGLIIIVNALSIVQRTILTKAIDFKYQAIISVTSTLLSGVIGIMMAYKGYGVWSLIAQQLSRAFITTCMFWVKSSWYPKIEFSISSFKKLFSFGWKILVSSLIGTIGTEINSAVIGKVYTKEALGLYTRAKQFTDVFSIRLTSIIRRVTFPAFSSIQQDEDYLLNTYRRMLRLVSLLSCSSLMFLAAIAEPLINVLLGEKWIACVPYLVLSCFMWFFYSSNVLNLNILQVKGRSDFFLYDQILAVIFGFIPLIVAVYHSIIYMLVASIIVQFLMYIVGVIFSSKVIQYSLKLQIRDLIPVFSVSFIVFIVVYFTNYINITPLLLLLVQSIIGFITFYLFTRMLCKQEFSFMRQAIIRYFSRRRNN